MRGPCFWDNAWSERCGDRPSLCKCPIIGSFEGEGGRFLLSAGLVKSHLMRKKDTRDRMKRYKNGESSDIFMCCVET